MTDKELERKELIDALRTSASQIMSEISYKLYNDLDYAELPCFDTRNQIEERYEFLARDLVHVIENYRYELDRLNK